MSFSMAVRSKATQGPLRRRRTGRAGHDQGAGERPVQTRVSSSPARGGAHMEPVHRSLRQGGASQDRALYSCGCGYAFDAPVSTSVDCPHCGDRQAW